MRNMFVLLLFAAFSHFSFADPDNETFESCAAGRNSQDCYHINQAGDRFNAVEARADAVAERLDTVESNEGVADGRLNALEAVSASNEGRLDGLEASSATADGRLNALEAGSSNSSDRLGDLETSTSVTESAVSGLDARVEALEAGGGQNAAKRAFVGISSIEVLGTDGWPSMNEACLIDFGLGASMCDEQELLQTPSVTPDTLQTTALNAWVRPVIITAWSDEYSRTYTLTFGGYVGGLNPVESCGSRKGYAMNIEKGAFQSLACTTTLPVLCCK